MNQEELTIITQALDLLDFAEYLPRELITQPGGKRKQPSTIGEYIVTYVIHPLLTHDWSSPEAERITDDLLFILSSLDIDATDSKSWDELFAARNEARKSLASLD